MSNPAVTAFLACALAAASATSPSRAQEPLAQSHACADIPDATERLACFDQAFPPTPEAVEAREEVAREQFGLSEDERNQRNPDRPKDSTPGHIQAAITDLSYRRSGERLITLDNGQMWLETASSRHGVLSEGDAVEIRSAVGGSYRLFTPARVGLRVRRVK